MNVKTRDYDEEPIVIEDYNYIFGMMYLIVATIVVLYFYFINPFGAHNAHSRNYFFIHAIFIIIIPGLVYYFQIKESKRQILLKKNQILFKEGDRIIEIIQVKDIKIIKKTFNDYYMKNQDAGDIEALFLFLFLPFNLPIQLINKFFFHLFKDGIKSYKLFDSIIIFDEDEKFINILPTTEQEREMIRIYFYEKIAVDLEDIEIFLKFNFDYKEEGK